MNEKKFPNESGQSLILVAAAMVMLVLFVAITVDVSSAYYSRRTAQNAADGAALAGVSRMATGINKKNARLDDDIQKDMNDFAERNGIADTNEIFADTVNANVEGWYVDAEGNRLSGEPKVGTMDKDYLPAGGLRHRGHHPHCRAHLLWRHFRPRRPVTGCQGRLALEAGLRFRLRGAHHHRRISAPRRRRTTQDRRVFQHLARISDRK